MKITKYIVVFSFILGMGVLSCSHQSRQLSDEPTSANTARNDSISKLFDPKIATRKAAKLDTFFKKLHKFSGFNGAVPVSQHGKIIYKNAFGYSEFF
ncbi:MAG: hypothetical protein U5M51_01140 [Emticicia sp.]|nr:hypothetical protein [Emticicia sp.]